MVLGQIIATLGRRWYLVLLGLAATVVLGYFSVILTPPTFQATGTVLLLPSKEQMSRGGQNPFLQLSDLDTPASIVIASLNGDERHIAIERMSPTADYTVQFDESLRGPGVQVVVSDRTEASALAIMHVLLDAVPETLDSLQASRNVPEAATVGSMPLVVATEAEKSTSDTVRAGVAAVGVGLILTAGFVFAIDGLLNRRGPRRAQASHESETDTDTDTDTEADDDDAGSSADKALDLATVDKDETSSDGATVRDGTASSGASGPGSPSELDLSDSDLAARGSGRAR